MKHALLAVFLAFAGCISPVVDIPEEPPELNFFLESERCLGSSLFWMPPFSTANQYLPAGFRAEDAGNFFGTPAIGSALFTIILSQCESEAELRNTVNAWILIKEPRGTELGLEDGTHWYEVQYYTDDLESMKLLQELFLPVSSMEIQFASFNQPPNLQANAWNLIDGDQVLFLQHEAAGVPFDATGATTVWHAAPEGVTTQTFFTEVNALIGTGSCLEGTTHPLLTFLDGQCTLGGQTLLYTSFVNDEVTIEVQFHPGVYPK